MKPSTHLTLAAASLLTAFTTLGAATLTWDPNANGSGTAATGNWDTSAAFWYNGTSDVTWPGTGNSALFKDTSPAGSAYTVTVQAGGVTAGGIEFQNSLSASATATLTGGVITLSNGGAGVLIKNSAAGSGSAAAITSVLTGSENVTFTAGSNLQLGAAATYTGTTNITSGNLRLTVSNALPTGTALTMSGGSIILQGANIGLTVASLASSNTSNKINTNTNGTSTVTVNGSANTSYAGLLNNGSSGSQIVALTRAGTGTLTLTNTNSTYTGATTISGGTLKLGSTAAINLASTGSVTISGGTLTNAVGNTNLGTGAVSMSSGAITPGGIGVIGSFTLAADKIFSTTGGTLNFDIGGSFDQIIGSGTGTFSLLDSTLALSGSTSVVGTYQLFSGFSSGSVSNVTITGLSGGFTGVLSNTGLLTVSAVPEPSTYAVLAGAAVLGLAAFRRRARC
jgi:autotransporter-associated beta strand protein